MFKKTLLLFMLFSGINTIIAQTQNVTCLKDSTIEFHEDGSWATKIYYLYNSIGQITEEKIFYDYGYSKSKTYQYDSQNRLISTLSYEDSILYKKITCTYSSTGKLLEELEQDTTSNGWENINKMVNTYNQIDTLIEKDNYSFINNDWFKTNNNKYEYDNQGRITYQESTSWNYYASHLDSSRYFTSYSISNGNNKVVFVSEHFYNNLQAFYVTDSTIRITDSNDNLIEEEKHFSNPNNPTNDRGIKKLYSYNAANLVTVEEELNFSYITQIWSNDLKSVNSYNNNDKRVNTLKFKWNHNSSTWDSTSKLDITYLNPKVIGEYKLLGFNQNQTWDTTQYYKVIFNSQDSTYTTYTRNFTNGSFNGLSSSLNFKYDNQDNLLLYKYTGYYNGDINSFIHENNYYSCTEIIDDLGLSDVHIKRLEMYPNPATEEITIEVLENTNVVIFDLTGAQVMSSVLTTGSNQLNVSELKNGLYIVRLANGQHAKLLKK